MFNVSLALLVFVLGLRHGLDADHLAFIDGQTRYNWRVGSPIARWVGTLFSFGHGSIVTSVAVIVGMFMEDFKFPDYFTTFSTWASVISLLLIGTINIINLVCTQSQSGDFQLRGIKGKFIPRIVQETTNPFVIVLVGAIFALAADTVSQTSVWAIAAGNAGGYMPLLLGLIFMIGMMTTDTIDSLVAYRMISHSSKLGQSASRVVGWIIVFLAYGVSIYEAINFLNPSVEINFEIVGICAFVLLVGCYFVMRFAIKKKTALN